MDKSSSARAHKSSYGMQCNVQTMALLRDYDVTWPSGTHNALSWADTLNIGVSITAPQCYIGDSFNFYFFYVLQMAMPVGSPARS